MDKLKDHDKSQRLTLTAMAIALVAGILLSFALGRYPISPRETLGIPLSRVFPIEPF